MLLYAESQVAAANEGPLPLGTSYIIKTIRLLPIEDHAFNQACEALGGLERAQLMQEAVLFEAYQLGVRYSASAPRPLNKPWPFLPDRGGEDVTDVRVSISMRVTVAELMSAAAEHVKASETLFIVGATLAYIGRLQSCYRGTHAASPADAREARAGLRKIKLPARYRYRVEK
jgi:hypothetical protein